MCCAFDCLSFVDLFKVHFNDDFDFENICPDVINFAIEEMEYTIPAVVRNHKYARLYLAAHLLYVRNGTGHQLPESSDAFSSVSLDKISCTLNTKVVGKESRHLTYGASKYGARYLEILDENSLSGLIFSIKGDTTPADW